MPGVKYIKLLTTNIKELIDNNTIIVGDFNTVKMDSNGQIIQTENQQGNSGFEWHTGLDGFSRYIHNIPS